MATTPQTVKAALIIIGNEILSGRTQDKNLAFLGTALNDMGIRLSEVRVVADDEQAIISAVNTLRAQYDLVFTSGGIGPTHDDITTACIAKAFGVAVIRHPEAVKLLEEHYSHDPSLLNASRLKMADVPEGAALLENPVSKAPGYRVENVYVMAGVPKILQSMFACFKHELTQGAKMLSASVSASVREGDLAAPLTSLQAQYPYVEMGSYPYYSLAGLGTTIILRTPDPEALSAAERDLRAMLTALGAELMAERPDGVNQDSQ